MCTELLHYSWYGNLLQSVPQTILLTQYISLKRRPENETGETTMTKSLPSGAALG